MTLLKDQVEHYGSNYNIFTLDEKINDRGDDFTHRQKLTWEVSGEVDQRSFEKLSKADKQAVKHYIRVMG
jgi:hypothetical protein